MGVHYLTHTFLCVTEPDPSFSTFLFVLVHGTVDAGYFFAKLLVMFSPWHILAKVLQVKTSGGAECISYMHYPLAVL